MVHLNQDISIWEAKSQLAFNEPLKPGDPLYVKTDSARGDFSLKRLYRELNVDNQGMAHSKPAAPRKQYTLFTGHRGCGKSTELLRIADYLHSPDRYYVIHLDCLEKLDINNLKYSDVLLALAAALLEQLEKEDGIVIDQVFLTRLENWFKERVEVHTALQDFAAEVKAGAKIQTGLPWLGKLFGELTNKINIGSTYREELRLVVRNNFTEFADAFNQLILAGEEKIRAAGKGQRILFTVDGTDRLDQEDAPKFFVEDVHQLTQINGLFIYCAPIHLLHQDNCITASFNQPFRLPMLKVRDRDGEDIPENIAVMRELALRRVPEQLFDEIDTVDYLVRFSGGHPRDLLRLLNVAINYADEERIDRSAAEKAVKQVANEYRRFINTEDYSRLVQIDMHPDAPDDFTDEQSSLMLYNLILLEYNDYFWKSHPLITTLPGYKKAKYATE
ncbi:ATP-binding protein [Candidatus Electrothrix sp.]|uniref:ATP-binding protein n=1 Tax=Candidatus Electrothrix sp. TaxID=2170559 RepID=UPI004055F73D